MIEVRTSSSYVYRILYHMVLALNTEGGYSETVIVLIVLNLLAAG